MKKLLIALTTSMLTITTIPSVLFSEQKTNIIKDKKINWYEVKTNLTKNTLKDIMSYQGISNANITIAKDNPAMLEKAHEEAFKYIEHFENKNINTLEDVTTYLKNNIKKFRENFKISEQLNETKNIGILNRITRSLAMDNYVQVSVDKSLDKTQAIKDTEETISKLKMLDAGLLTIAVIADVATAGFWAASWFFGISVPWAVAATSLATALHVIHNAVHVFLVNKKTLDPKIDEILPYE